MILIVLASSFGGWQAGGIVVKELDARTLNEETSKQKGNVSAGSIKLRMDESLNLINAQREARKNRFASKTVFLEKVSYERSAGAVVARGSVSDWGSPRTLVVVIDAFDSNGSYMASGSSTVDTRQGSTGFSVSISDNDAFQRFSVRFLDQQMEDVIMRTFADERKVPPLLIDDPLHTADLIEVAKRLVLLGYAEDVKPLKDEIVASAIIKRFRQDNGISGPNGVTIGDLLALRLVSPPVAETASLEEY